MDILKNIRDYKFFSYCDNFARYANIPSDCIFHGDDNDVLVTICIVTYKRAHTLKEAIDSALAQENYTDYQVFVLDNNPERNDETEMLMERYRISKVSYFKHRESLGMAGNFNRCFTLSKSKWVVLLHDDDTIEPDFLRKCMKYLEGHDCSILQTLKYSEPNGRPSNIEKPDTYEFARLDQVFYHRIQAPSGIIFKREDVIQQGGFNPDYYPSLDYCYCSKALRTQKIVLLKDYLTYYRKEINTSIKEETQLLFLIIDYFLIKQDLEDYGFPDFLINCYQQHRIKIHINGVKEQYHYNLQLPEEINQNMHFSILSEFFGFYVIRFFELYERIKNRKIW